MTKTPDRLEALGYGARRLRLAQGRSRFQVIAGGGAASAPVIPHAPPPEAGEEVDLASHISQLLSSDYRKVSRGPSAPEGTVAMRPTIPITEILFEYTESGYAKENVPLRSVNDAERILNWLNRKALDRMVRRIRLGDVTVGGYSKTVIRVRWADGAEWRPRFDIDGTWETDDLFGDEHGGGITWGNTTDKTKTYAHDTELPGIAPWVEPDGDRRPLSQFWDALQDYAETEPVAGAVLVGESMSSWYPRYVAKVAGSKLYVTTHPGLPVSEHSYVLNRNLVLEPEQGESSTYWNLRSNHYAILGRMFSRPWLRKALLMRIPGYVDTKAAARAWAGEFGPANEERALPYLKAAAQKIVDAYYNQRYEQTAAVPSIPRIPAGLAVDAIKIAEAAGDTDVVTWLRAHGENQATKPVLAALHQDLARLAYVEYPLAWPQPGSKPVANIPPPILDDTYEAAKEKVQQVSKTIARHVGGALTVRKGTGSMAGTISVGAYGNRKLAASDVRYIALSLLRAGFVWYHDPIILWLEALDPLHAFNGFVLRWNENHGVTDDHE